MYFIVSSVLVLLGMIVAGAGIANYDPVAMNTSALVRAFIGGFIFFSGVALAAYGSFTQKE
jgi:hypothetical protein